MSRRPSPSLLFVGHSAGRSGAPIVLLHLLNWLRRNGGPELDLLLLEDGPLRDEYAQTCSTFLCEPPLATLLARLGFGRALRAPLMKWGRPLVPRSIRRREFDLIYLNSIASVPALELLDQPRESTVLHVHELSHWIDRTGPRALELVRRRVGRIVAASRAVEELLVGGLGFPASEIEVVHEFLPVPPPPAPADRRRQRERLGITDTEFLVLGSGFETWRKGKDLFVELAHRSRRPGSARGMRFVWTGGWENRLERRRLEALVVERQLQGVVRFVGEVGDQSAYLAAADAFALVSREDPFPLVAIEAAAAHLPVLCFAGGGGAPELVEGDAGFVIADGDLDAMAARLLELAGDPALVRRLGGRGAARARERCDVDVAAPRILEIIGKQIELARATAARDRSR